MGAPEVRPLPGDLELVALNGACTDWAKHERTHNALTDCECTGGVRKAWNRVTRFQAALGLSAVVFLVTTGLLVYIGVLKASECSERPQAKGAQSNAIAYGKDGEVLLPCGDYWIRYQSKCFYFSEEEGSWTEAKDSCAALNSFLAMIDTQQELDFMLRYKGDRHHWIGLQRETDQQWKWVNGTEFRN